MTREEALNKAINIVAYFEAHFAKSKEAREEATNIIEALEQEPKTDVLDKIRAEIDEQYDRVHPYNISCAEGLEMALEIIDKYRAESEEDE